MSKGILWGLIVVLLWAMPVLGQDLTPDEGYQEALRRIEAATINGSTTLDLSGLGLIELPAEIGYLINLQRLYLTDNQLKSLPIWIGELSKLRLLDLEKNQLMSLPSEIGQLINLQELYLSGNNLITLPLEVGQLTKLQNFYIAHNPIKSLPLEMVHLSQLVDFYGPQISFPPLDIQQQGVPAILAYLRDYEAMQVRQTIAGIAAGVGGIAGLMLAFSWRQRRGLNEKKKRV